MKQSIKKLLHTTGALSMYHRTVNRRTLTVAMLHRVLPRESFALHGANPQWTLSTEVFESLLLFFQRHYTPIGLGHLLDSKKNLPSNALLLTFDDGWRDNYSYAFPLLQKYQFPATVFLVTDAIGENQCFWQEVLYHYLHYSDDSHTRLKNLIQQFQLPDTISNYHELIEHLTPMSLEPVRQRVCDSVATQLHSPRQMLNRHEIAEMVASGLIAFGSHGASHTKLTLLTEDGANREARVSQRALQQLQSQVPPTLSFPHGGYNQAIIELFSRHFNTLFSSDEYLNVHNANLLGRINISEHDICDAKGFNSLKAANHLFLRPRAQHSKNLNCR